MSRYSLHIGVDRTDPSAYPQPLETLAACVNDAEAFEEVAVAEKFDQLPRRLHNEHATARAVHDALHALSQELVAGDLLFLTYSGHGSQGPDHNEDEPDDHQDETWVLYDRQLFDDELWWAWSKFVPGVRIFLVSDSCNSGTVARMLNTQAVTPVTTVPPAGRSRRLPGPARTRDLRERSETYRAALEPVPSPDDVPVSATVLLIAACRDGEEAQERDGHGELTHAFLHVWNNGAFAGNHYDLFTAISERVRGQTPNYVPVSGEDPAFENQRPLT